jgi:hypothetical protein
MTKERDQAEAVIDAVCAAIGVDSGAFSDERMDAAVEALISALAPRENPFKRM